MTLLAVANVRPLRRPVFPTAPLSIIEPVPAARERLRMSSASPLTVLEKVIFAPVLPLEMVGEACKTTG